MHFKILLRVILTSKIKHDTIKLKKNTKMSNIIYLLRLISYIIPTMGLMLSKEVIPMWHLFVSQTDIK